MGWLVVIFAPLLFALIAAYLVVRVFLALVRLAFLPLALRRR
jgi:hypothetical protein